MPGVSYKLIRTAKAESDLEDIRDYTIKKHGPKAAKAYTALLRQAFKDIREDPFRPGSHERPEIGVNVRSYHIALSKARAESNVKRPRHFVLYFLPKDNEVVVSRILHDSRDLPRHIPREDIGRARDFKAKRRKTTSKSKGRER